MSLFGFLFKRKKPEIPETKETFKEKQIMPKQKKFVYEVMDYDANGNPMSTQEEGFFTSKNELINLYSMTGQKIRIISETDDTSPSMNQNMDPSMLPPDVAKTLIKDKDGNIAFSSNQTEQSTKIEEKPAVQHYSAPTVVSHPQIKKSEPPKYFSISGIECKLDNGKVYQKQWVKLLGNEANNYRLISDSSNKEISMQGKHLEVLKWVSVENESDADTTESIKQILNG